MKCNKISFDRWMDNLNLNSIAYNQFHVKIILIKINRRKSLIMMCPKKNGHPKGARMI